jgi:hypothetical protein
MRCWFQLQVAFSQGLLKSGTYAEQPKEKKFINDEVIITDIVKN